MASRAVPAIEPGRRRQAHGERSIFSSPGGAAPLGAIVASVRDRDGPNDKSAKLSREGVYRLALCLTPERFAERFGQPPRRAPKGGVVDLAGRQGEVDPQEGRLMLEMTWAWIALDTAALDLANTVAVDKGVEYDLLALDNQYERWAQAAARSPELTPEEAAAIAAARPHLLGLREHIRAVLHATAADQPLPGAAVAALNAASRAAAEWPEFRHDGHFQEHAHGDALQRLLARYARSTMELAAGGSAKLRVCGAPSCGLFYRPRRRQQCWCSEPCGNRARVARHYRAHHSSSPNPAVSQQLAAGRVPGAGEACDAGRDQPPPRIIAVALALTLRSRGGADWRVT